MVGGAPTKVQLLKGADGASPSGIQVLNKEETRVIYAHGHKSNGGEVFIEIHNLENGYYWKVGCRQDMRHGTKSSTAIFTVSQSYVRVWLHVAVVFDGRWRLYLNGNQVAASKRDEQQVPLPCPPTLCPCASSPAAAGAFPCPSPSPHHGPCPCLALALPRPWVCVVGGGCQAVTVVYKCHRTWHLPSGRQWLGIG